MENGTSGHEAVGRITRRGLLALIGFGAMAAGVGAACQPSAPAPTVPPKAPDSKPTEAAKPAEPKPAAQPTTVAPAATQAPAAAKPAAPSGSLRLGQATIPDTLDPHQSTSGTYMPAYYALFDTLTLKDENGQLKPALASSWRSVDDRTWEFKLRPDVKFQNGEPFDASAVKYSLDRIMQPGATKAGWRRSSP